MAKVARAYQDTLGNLHSKPELAAIADLASAIGRVGEEGGLTGGVARLIFEKRQEIEAAFADYDAIMATEPKPKPILAVAV